MGEAALRDYSGNGNNLIYNNGSGIQVQNFGKYEIEKNYTSNIETYEAWICFPAAYVVKKRIYVVFKRLNLYLSAIKYTD